MDESFERLINAGSQREQMEALRDVLNEVLTAEPFKTVEEVLESQATMQHEDMPVEVICRTTHKCACGGTNGVVVAIWPNEIALTVFDHNRPDKVRPILIKGDAMYEVVNTITEGIGRARALAETEGATDGGT